MAAYYTVPIEENVPETYKPFISEGSMPEITVTHQKIDMPKGTYRAVFKDVKYDKKLYDVLTEQDRDVQLLINVFSGRKSSDLNLLNCDIFQDKMSVIAGKDYAISCTLIRSMDA